MALGASTPWNEVEPGLWHEAGQALHEFEQGHDDVYDTVLVGAFQLQYVSQSAKWCDFRLMNCVSGNSASFLYFADG